MYASIRRLSKTLPALCERGCASELANLPLFLDATGTCGASPETENGQLELEDAERRDSLAHNMAEVECEELCNC